MFDIVLGNNSFFPKKIIKNYFTEYDNPNTENSVEKNLPNIILC